MLVFANILQPLIDFFEAFLVVLPRQRRAGLGHVDRRADGDRPRALLPLTLKQFRSMQALARLQPEIKELQEKYKGDRERLTRR